MTRFRTGLGLATGACLAFACQDSAAVPAPPMSACPTADEASVVAQKAYVGTNTPTVSADVLSCNAAPAARSGECADALGGSYAIRYQLDVYWQDELNALAPSFDPGRGTLTLLARAELGEFCDGAHARVAVRSCGLQFPGVASEAARAMYQLSVPDAAWDGPGMPSILTTAEVSGFGHADRMTFEPIVETLGIELSDAESDWPDYRDTPFFACSEGHKGADCFPDQDTDGQPGITLHVQTTGSAAAPSGDSCERFRYAPFPTSPTYAPEGARELLAGVRVQLRGAQPIGADCDGGTGPMDSAEIALRVLDCTQDDGSPCTATAATYVDQTLPVFHVLSAGQTPPASWRDARPAADAALDRTPSAGPQQTALRLGDASDALGCSDVRAALAD